MAIQLIEVDEGKVLEITLSGKLTKADYETFTPEVERLIAEHGKLRLLVSMTDFHGWELGALWEDTKFDLRHYADFEKLALLGDSKWEKGMAAFCKPFTKANIRFFPTDDRSEAESWLRE
tara:strand:- start:797 stop:1156 length:360 start_codon:yes stop_codon:yes gene_type:complete